jgi:hypothetical protein
MCSISAGIEAQVLICDQFTVKCRAGKTVVKMSSVAREAEP